MKIYCVTNNIDGKQYVGKTNGPIKYRWGQHVRFATRNVGTDKIGYLGKAILKHGAENFSVSELAVATSDNELDGLEIEWIARLGSMAPNGYNMHPGGEGGAVVGESLEKIKRSWTPERKAKHAARIRELNSDPAYRAAIGERAKRAWANPESRAKLSATLKELRNRPEERERLRKQRAIDLLNPDIARRRSEQFSKLKMSPDYRHKLSIALKAKCADKEWLAWRAERIRSAREKSKQQKEVNQCTN